MPGPSVDDAVFQTLTQLRAVRSDALDSDAELLRRILSSTPTATDEPDSGRASAAAVLNLDSASTGRRSASPLLTGEPSRAQLALELLRSMSPVPAGRLVTARAVPSARASPDVQRHARVSAPAVVGGASAGGGVASEESAGAGTQDDLNPSASLTAPGRAHPTDRRPTRSPLPPRPAAPTPTARPHRWAQIVSPVPPSHCRQGSDGDAGGLGRRVDDADVSMESNGTALDDELVMPPALAHMFHQPSANNNTGRDSRAADGDGAHRNAAARSASPAVSAGVGAGDGNEEEVHELRIRLETDGTASVIDGRDAAERTWAGEPLFEVRVRGSRLRVTALRYHPPSPLVVNHTTNRASSRGMIGAPPAVPTWFNALRGESPLGSPHMVPPASVVPDSPPNTGARRSIRVRALFDNALGVVDAGAAGGRPSSRHSDGAVPPAKLDLSGRATLRHIARGTLGDALLEAASPRRSAPANLMMSAQ
jgi:hypothetical protein